MQVGIKFSTAIHTLLCAKFFEDEKVTSEFIAGSINTNPVIVRKLLGVLKAAGLVNVAAGVGGVSLAKEPKDINLLEIFNTVNDKEKLFKIHSDSPKACPLGGRIEELLSGHFLRAQTALENELKNVTLQDLLDELAR